MSEIREIIGNTTATPTPRSDWEQTDPTKADYIKNKPDLTSYVKNEDYEVTADTVRHNADSIAQINETYVRYTDYADNGTAGVVKLSTAESCGLCSTIIDDKKVLSVYSPNTSEIKQRYNKCVLVAGDLDEYIKVGITGLKSQSGVETLGNQITLSDKEKASAQAWLGVPSVSNKSSTINGSYSGEPVQLVNGEAYLQTETVYSSNDLIGSKVSYRYSSSYGIETSINESHIDKKYTTNDGIAFKFGAYSYIFVVYNTNYKPSLLKSSVFPKAGIYFSSYDDGDTNDILYLVVELQKIDDKYLDLVDHPVIKEILARIEALEAK